MKNIETAEDFLKIHDEFSLGDLLTESQHPKTIGLDSLAKSNIAGAFDLFKEVDSDALSIFRKTDKAMQEWLETARKQLQSGGRIFLGGCGATGRLSLGLEFLWSRLCERGDIKFKKEQVISFMAGGDVALIASIEKFEDFPSYGAKQLEELGFGEDDIFVGITEGGETPWVIGATLWASKRSKHPSYFFYCNPDEVLIDLTERTHEVLLDLAVKKVNLTCGAMALSGSTRLQASTVLMLGVGMGLFFSDNDSLKSWWTSFERTFDSLDYKAMAPFCCQEASIYKDGNFTQYICDEDFGLTVLTDTTERSPTFSLASFENLADQTKNPAWTYLATNTRCEGKEAWEHLLGRAPRALEWAETIERTGLKKLLGFPVGSDAQKFRKLTIANLESRRLSFFHIHAKSNLISFQLDQIETQLDLGEHLFTQVMLLKMLLNAHSTLLMGRLGRFESNVMTYVRPSNNKLIDRMARYALTLLKERGVECTFEQVVELYFEMRSELSGVTSGAERPVVIELVNRLVSLSSTKAKDTSL